MGDNSWKEKMTERFGRDREICLATLEGDRPWVRTVNSYYEDGSFYVITYALSNKIKQLAENPNAAICGDWFTAHGVGENLGWVLAEENAALLAKLKEVFSAWYGNGDINESDPNTCILRIRLTDGVLFWHGARYDIDFTQNA